MDVNREALEEAIHESLRGWQTQGTPPPTALDDLLLIQERRAALAQDGHPLAVRLATNQVLWEALEALERQDETAAQVLRWRFADQNTLLMVAHRLNVSQHAVSRQQRAAISQLAALLEARERELRDRRIQQLEAQLPPPSYTRLFGIEERRDHLSRQLLQAEGPGVVAIVGIGGIGKTALADLVTRDLSSAFAFDGVLWLRHESRTMSGRSLSPEQGFEALLAELTGPLGVQSGVTSSSERLSAVRRRLKQAPYLVVVDNLEGDAVADYLLERLIELAEPSRFLLTTRRRPCGRAAVRHVSLSELSLEHAGQLLRHHAADLGITAAENTSEEEVARIYEVTGGNPLALKLVVGLLDPLPLRQVLEELAHGKRGLVAGMYRHIYWQTWRTLGSAARTLLQAMPLVAESGGKPEYLQAISGLDDDGFWPALQQLRARSLLEVRGTLDEKRYGVHRLTETFVRTEIVKLDEEGMEHNGAALF